MGSQHYYFVHRALPQLLQENTSYYVNGLASEEGPDFLNRVWQKCGEINNENSPSTGLNRFTVKISDDCYAVVIRMPEPEDFTEAYYSAIVYWPNRPSGPEGGEPNYRYFTLELGEAEDGSHNTMLCEWQGGRHGNFGEGPPPDERAFLQAVIKKISERSGYQAGYQRPSY